MRLTALHLERYGPFTGHTLTFAEDARLHLVLGRNEAGKTSALAAIGDLLYGIPPTSRYAFRHAKPTLRIGAEILGAGGRRLSFVRRNGRLNTLVDPDGEPLADDSLAAFLCGVDRTAFEQAFGLDAARLEAGAEAMLSTRGEIGESMFAAASGLGALSDLRAGLDAEADAIFAPRRAGHRSFYQAIDRHKEAEETLRASEVAARDWDELKRAIAEAAAAQDDAGRRWREAMREMRRIEALERAAPIVRDLETLDRALAALGPLPATEAGFADRLEEALADDRESAAALDGAIKADEKARDFADRIAVDERVLAHADAIEAAFAAGGSDRDRRGMLDELVARVESDRAAAGQLASRLGLPDLGALESALPTAADAAAVRAGAEAGETITARLAQFEEARADALEEVERLEHARADEPIGVDPAPLRDRFASLTDAVQQAERQWAAEPALATRAAELAEAVARLDPPIECLDRLAATPLPAPAALGAHEKERDRLRHARRDAERDRDQAADDVAAIEAEIARLAAGEPLVTPAAMAEARAARERLFETVAALAMGAPCDGDRAAAIAAYRRQCARVDQLADAAIEGSDRVAALTHKRTARDSAEARHDAARDALRALEEEDARHEAAWRALWRGIVTEPHDASRMRAWLADVAGLLAQRAELRAETARREAVKAAADAALPEVRALARELALETAALPEDAIAQLVHLGRAVEARLQAREAAFRERLADTVRLDAARERLARSERDAAAHRAGRERWEADWQLRLSAAGLCQAWSPPEALAALDAFDEAARHIADARPRERLLTKTRSDLAAFEAGVAELVALVGEPADGAADSLAERLYKRLNAARLDAVRKEEAEKAAADAAHARAEAADRRTRAAETLAALGATLPSEPPLEDLCTRLKERDKLAARRGERLQDLENAAGGQPLETLRADVSGFDPVEAEARRLELEREEAQLRRASEEAFASIERLREQRQAMEANVSAEHAAAMVRAAEAELATHARDYLVRKVAATMLVRAAEKHRASKRGRLLARADQIFAMLTCGAFAAIEEVVDDSGEVRVAGRRPDGEIVEVAAMSEGSRAQFYLALRLAYLEQFAERGEAPPFIADDLFTSFDEPRTTAGLKVLAEVGDKLQPILFTHHRFLADLAVRALGSDVEIIDLDRAQGEPDRVAPLTPIRERADEEAA